MGWKGVLLVTSVIIFWLLLQFSQLMRIMRRTGSAPVGYTADALQLQARVKPGMTLLQVVQATGSLGHKTGTAPDVYTWSDAHHRVDVTMADAKVAQVVLRPATDSATNLPTPDLHD